MAGRRGAPRTRSHPHSRSSRRYYPHIYFESKRPGRDSVTRAVLDRGRPGVRSAEEVRLLAFAQLADYADGKTVDHHGRVIRFTPRLWAGRTLVLRRLAARYGGKRAVELAQKYKELLEKTRSAREKRRILLRAAREMGIPRSTAQSIIRRVTQKR